MYTYMLGCRLTLLRTLTWAPFANSTLATSGSLQCKRGILVILWMSLRVGIVPCVSKFDTLGLFLSLLKEKFS